MATVNVRDILARVYGYRGLPFPGAADGTQELPVAGAFEGSADLESDNSRTRQGTPLRGQNLLGRPVFMPVKLGGVELQNPLVTITGEKSIIETDVTEVGTVFEKVFTRPYDISIICTLINPEGSWPEEQLQQMQKLYAEGDLYTLECALTDIFLQPKNNFLLTRISLLDMQGIENSQVVQFDGRSNVDFELEILN